MKTFQKISENHKGQLVKIIIHCVSKKQDT